MSDAYNFDISQRPDFALLRVQLAQGQELHAEPSAMASMDANIKMTTSLRGGMFKSFKRVLGGESLVMNTFSAPTGPGEVCFAPGPMGDIFHYRLDGGCLMIQRGGFVAHGTGVEVDSSWDGARGFFNEGLFLLKAKGHGDVFFNTYGAMIEVDVKGEYFIDNGYIVAFEDTLDYQITTLPGLRKGGQIKSFLFGGEGLVCRFRGEGRVWVQSRTIQPFLRWVNPYRPVKTRHDN